jgi:hypothetical protein
MQLLLGSQEGVALHEFYRYGYLLLALCVTFTRHGELIEGLDEGLVEGLRHKKNR